MATLEKIQALKENQYCFFNNDTSQVWLKNETYFLFSIPLFGGRPRFEQAFEKSQIDNLVLKIESFT